jgi:hypothetical protein
MQKNQFQSAASEQKKITEENTQAIRRLLCFLVKFFCSWQALALAGQED